MPGALDEMQRSRATAPRGRVQVPELPDGAVERRALSARLDAAVVGDGAVVTVVAPPGYGKTTSLAQWARHLRAAGRPVAWVTCSDRDNDPATMLQDVRDAAALALKADAPAVSEQLADLAEPTPAALDSVLDTLLLVLDELTTPLILVVDDVHLVTGQAAQDVLAALVRRLPTGLRLVLAGRTEPQPLVTMLRLHAPLLELQAAHLALTVEEIGAVVTAAGLTGSVGPAPEALGQQLLAQTEGWPAAVRLGVLAAASGRLGEGMVLPLSDDAAVSDYLTGQILATLPDEAVALLERTAVLPEMTPSLAAHLSGRPDAGQILDALFARQALVRRVGSGEPTYLVHSLLRSHVLRRLAAGDVEAPARQHATAAGWWVEHSMPERALGHAVESGDPTLVAALVREVGPRLLTTDRTGAVLDALDTLTPSDWDGDLTALAALARAETGDVAGAWEMVAEAADPSSIPRDSLPSGSAAGESGTPAPALLRVAQFQLRRLTGRADDPALPRDFDDIVSWSADPDPAEQDLDRQLLLLASRGQWEFASGRHSECWEDLRLALRLATAHRRDRIAVQCMSTLAGVPTMAGQAATTDRYVAEVLSLMERRGWAVHPSLAHVYSAGAWAAWHMLLPSRAAQLIARAKESLGSSPDPDYAAYPALIDAVLAGDRPGDPTSALATLTAFAQLGPAVERGAPVRAFAAWNRIHIPLRLGDLSAATAAIDDFERWIPGTGTPHVARAQILATQRQWVECRSVLRGVHGAGLPMAVPIDEVMLPLLTAVTAQQLGDAAGATTSLRRALDIAAPRGTVRPFAEVGPTARTLLLANRDRIAGHEAFIATILDRWQRAERHSERVPGGEAPQGGVTLTRRELEVLRELHTLMTAEELAEAQLVSVNTIRTHMRTLYQKLGVHNRREAVRRGRELGLL